MSHITSHFVFWQGLLRYFESPIPHDVRVELAGHELIHAIECGESWKIRELIAEVEATAVRLGHGTLKRRKERYTEPALYVANRLRADRARVECEKLRGLILSALVPHVPYIRELHEEAQKEQGRDEQDKAESDKNELMSNSEAPSDTVDPFEHQAKIIRTYYLANGLRHYEELHAALLSVAECALGSAEEESLNASADLIAKQAKSLAKLPWLARASSLSRADLSILVSPDHPPVEFSSEHKFLRTVKQSLLILARRYRWSEPNALAWLALEGITPPSAQVIVDFEIDDQDRIPSRIVLTLDPALSPKEVAKVYGQARERVIGPSKVKGLHAVTIQLVAHVYLDATHPPPRPPANLATDAAARARFSEEEDRFYIWKMHEWNRRYAPFLKPQKKEDLYYQSAAKFRREAESARDRMLALKVKMPEHARWFPRESAYRIPAPPKEDFYA